MKNKKQMTFLKVAVPFALALGLGSCLNLSPKNQTDKFSSPKGRMPTSDDLSRNDLPWEVHGFKGETLLPNVYYSEDSENQQVMPLTLADSSTSGLLGTKTKRLFIDHVIYPTLGNPALYISSAEEDRLMVVLRVEQDAVDAMGVEEPVGTNHPENINPKFENHINLKSGNLRIYLVPRNQRSAATAQATALSPTNVGSILITPSEVYSDIVTNAPHMPDVFKQRRTLRVVFDHSALQSVAQGLYDLRVEILGSNPVLDWQYNAVQIYNSAQDQYPIINVTDAQVSMGSAYGYYSTAILKDFQKFINSSTDPNIVNSPFITFNGDLHNGGSPAGVLPLFVASTYNTEAQTIIDILKDLNKPIFLTVGNHDGYSSMPIAPQLIEQDLEKNYAAIQKHAGEFQDAINLIKKVLHLQKDPSAFWPMQQVIDTFGTNKVIVQNIKSSIDGKHLDIVTGQFKRTPPPSTANLDLDAAWASSWHPLQGTPNLMLYDGFHQWQKTYGPLNYSWTYQKNHYVSMNSFELRQHRRSGWGMYTVNYGGWMSPTQIEWLDRDIEGAQKNGQDIILLAHHDPRGGHNGEDYPYQFEQVNFSGMGISATNYIGGEMIDPVICAKVPPNILRKNAYQHSDCMHDGLQEWMRPDPEFDCVDRYRDASGTCGNYSRDTLRPKLWNSGYEMVSRFAGVKNRSDTNVMTNLRTVLLGHTHYAHFEVLRSGDNLVPDIATLDAKSASNIRAILLNNPGRLKPGDSNPMVSFSQIGDTQLNVLQSYPDIQNRVQGDANRELAIIRMTSLANMTDQIYHAAPGADRTNFGFTIFHISNRPNYDLPQINSANFYVESPINPKIGVFDFVPATGPSNSAEPVAIDRTQRINDFKPDPSHPVAPYPLTPLFSDK